VGKTGAKKTGWERPVKYWYKGIQILKKYITIKKKSHLNQKKKKFAP
jgi:hypothetical protein